MTWTSKTPAAQRMLGLISLADDIAIAAPGASHFFVCRETRHTLTSTLSCEEMKKTAPQLADYYKAWLDKYPFVSIEDIRTVRHVQMAKT